MAITKFLPNTIWLGGPGTIVNDLPAGVAITPGYLVERYSNSGVASFRPHATAAAACEPAFAINQSMINKGVDYVYAIGDLVEVVVGTSGTTVWARLATGQNIALGAKLESAGNGTLRVLASGVIIAKAMEAVDASAAPKMIRVELA